MIDEARRPRKIGCVSVIAIYLIAWTALILLLCACTTTKYIPTETIKTEYRDREIERVTTDTVLDTRFVYIKGDTVIDWRERTNTRYIAVHDTTTILKTDSVAVPYPVERSLTRWEQVKQDVGGAAIGLIIFIISATVVWLIVKFRK